MGDLRRVKRERATKVGCTLRRFAALLLHRFRADADARSPEIAFRGVRDERHVSMLARKALEEIYFGKYARYSRPNGVPPMITPSRKVKRAIYSRRRAGSLFITESDSASERNELPILGSRIGEE